MGRDWQQTEDRSGEQSFPGAAIVIQRGVAHQRERRIEPGVFTMGSGKDCDLILGDEQFPELFAYIVRRNGEYRLRCLAANPVLTVNGEDTVTAKLEEGDRIRCGPYEFRFRRTALSPSRPADAARWPSGTFFPSWTATDGQSKAGIAASRQLVEAIQKLVLPHSAPVAQHRRSA